MKKLSILICHLTDRETNLAQLLSTLRPQADAAGDDVEILIETDNGEMPVGEKRNILLERAQGAYVAYVDDDDMVSEDYVASILDAISDNPDCVGIEGILYTNNAQLQFKHSIEFAGWYQSGDVFYRTPNHLNPIRADIARRVWFDASKSIGEDADYSKEIRQYLRTEKYIDHPVYFYNCLHVVCQNMGEKK